MHVVKTLIVNECFYIHHQKYKAVSYTTISLKEKTSTKYEKPVPNKERNSNKYK